MRIWVLNYYLWVDNRCYGLVELAAPYDRRMGVARQRGIGDSVAVPKHLGATPGVVHHRALRGVSDLALPETIVAGILPLIEQEGDVEYG